jgi:hypothetical protein
MTKKEARALLACKAKVVKAIESCLSQLSAAERSYAESYWAAHINSAITGQGYGSAPMGRAKLTLEDRQ